MFKRIILQTIRAEEEDWLHSKHLLLMGAFMGIFVATYTTAINVVFLEYLDEKNLLTVCYFCTRYNWNY